MSYLVLARKYRPAGFASVSGQEHVTRTLANAIKRERVVHAYLFTGPRGVGKTSVARILAKALNCQNSKDAEPCQKCLPCQEVAIGNSMAVREIDGASHNSVDNVRDLIDSFKALPPSGYRYKVYIIDEVHMLSISAFNALLKSLEEPPPNTVFILATTEIHKIPDTVISRCQRHDFRALTVETIESRLREVLKAEKISAEPEAVRLIARLADGSMRDAQTLLDRVQSFCDGNITATETSTALGSIGRESLDALAGAVLGRDIQRVLDVVSEIFSVGSDPAVLLREFVQYWREIFIAKGSGEKGLQSLGVSDDGIVTYLRLVSTVELIDIQDLWDVAREGADRCIRSSNPRLGFEALVVRMATRLPALELAALVKGSEIQGAVKERAAAKLVPSRKEEVSSPAVATSSAYSWEDFLQFVSSRVGPASVENYKRVTVTRFTSGVLEGTAPDFSVGALLKDKEKVSALLAEFAKTKGETQDKWKITLQKVGASSSTSSSGPAVEKKSTEVIEAHPAVQSVQKFFPGSKIESTRLKG